jgi:hypothetical protein
MIDWIDKTDLVGTCRGSGISAGENHVKCHRFFHKSTAILSHCLFCCGHQCDAQHDKCFLHTLHLEG